MKKLLLVMLFLFSCNAFAALSESEIKSKIATSESCKSTNQSNFGQCVDSIFSNSTGTVGVLSQSVMSPANAAVASAIAQGIIRGADSEININLTATEGNNDISLMLSLVSKILIGVSSLLFTINCIYVLFSLMIEEKQDESWAGWCLLNTSVALISISSLTFIFATVFAGEIVGSYFFMRYVQPRFAETASFDEQAYSQRAYKWADNVTRVVFSDGVLIASQTSQTATKLAIEGGAIQPKPTGVGMVYRSTDLVQCLSSTHRPDGFTHDSLIDGRVAVTQACLRAAGYEAFEPGSVLYRGVDREIQEVLIELNQNARAFEFEARKVACSKALSDERTRSEFESHIDAYQVCVNKNANGSFVPNQDGSIGFLEQSKLDIKSLSDFQTKYIKSANDKLTNIFVEKARQAKEKKKHDGSENFTIWMWNLFNRESGYLSWKDSTDEELRRISSSSGYTISTTGSELSKVEYKARQLAKDLSSNITDYQFIDYEKFIFSVIDKNGDSSEQMARGLVQYFTDLLAGDMSDTQALNFKNCFDPKSSCVSPFVNQFASLTVSSIIQSESYLKIYGVFKLVSEGVKVFSDNDSYVKYVDLVLSASAFGFTFSIAETVSSLLPFFVFSSLLLYYPLKSVFLVVGYGIDLLLMILPSDKNKSHKQFNTNLLSPWSAALWFLISPSVIISMFLVVSAMYSIVTVLEVFTAYIISSVFIVSSGEFINSVILFVVNVFVFKLIKIIVIVVMCRLSVRIIFNLQKSLCPVINLDGFSDKVNAKVENAMNKAKMAFN